MTYANLIMLGLGLVAFAIGVTLLVRRAATRKALMRAAFPGR